MKSVTKKGMLNTFSNKRILITAGPTWVPIDDVRVISNVATGETGILLAEALNNLGAKVSLFLGPVGKFSLSKKIRLFNFRFFDELKEKLFKELKARRYEIIIHSAAVSDFKPAKKTKGKIKSAKAQSLQLSPLPKIISGIRRLAPYAKVIMFKLESGISKKALIERARSAMNEAAADLIVACQLNPYRAFVIDKANNQVFVKNKEELADILSGKIN